jgi:hypothetical protein
VLTNKNNQISDNTRFAQMRKSKKFMMVLHRNFTTVIPERRRRGSRDVCWNTKMTAEKIDVKLGFEISA